MDKIWDRKSFEVGGHVIVVAGMKPPNDHAEPTNVEVILRLHRATLLLGTDFLKYSFTHLWQCL